MTETTAKELLPRENRYQIRDDRPLDVVIQRITLDGIETITGRVVEVSRSGVKLAVSGSIPFEETVPLKILNDDLGVEIEVQARVCWGRPGPGSTWTAGCRIAPAIDEKVIARLAEHGCLDRREAARTSIRLLTTVQWELQSTASPVSLTDLSTNGFGMRSAYCPALGQRLLVHVENGAGEGLSLPAQVEWTAKEKGGYAVGCCLLKSDDVRHLLEAARRHQRTFTASPTVNRPYSPWMFAALMVIAFIGPSAVYGLFRALAPTDLPPSVQLADSSAADETPRSDALTQFDSPNVENALTVDQMGLDFADHPAATAHPSPVDEQTAAAPATSDAQLPDMPLDDTTAPRRLTAGPPDDVSVTTVPAPSEVQLPEFAAPVVAAPEDIADAGQTKTDVEPPAPVILAPESAVESPPPVIPPPAQPAKVVQAPAAPTDDISPVPPRHVLLPAGDASSRARPSETTPHENATHGFGADDHSAADSPPAEVATKPSKPLIAPTDGAEFVQQPLEQNAADVKRGAAWWDRSYEQYRQGQLRQAAQSLMKASELDGANPLYVYLAAMIYHQLNDAETAERMIRRAAALERSHAIDDWGDAVRRYQGRPRVWLQRARTQALSRID